jgi:hypothetical protein
MRELKVFNPEKRIQGFRQIPVPQSDHASMIRMPALLFQPWNAIQASA